ncbi:MAG: GtrA family protein [Rhodoplanes sp.]|uniref:GtrA family protein n=1 Tax=Rhodoplanes sp. TaxID=1968906 RepID=UPI0017F5F6AA|nr:GtrA family protein [Rhodoplanes sp.]NVO15186.1 GtrA family protein [Rhodoplanes sp.]
MIRIGAPHRYLVVGAVCAGLNIALMGGFGALGLHWLPATVLAFPLVLVPGYLLHVHWTFVGRRSWASFRRYTLAMASNYPLYTVLLFGLCGLAGLAPGPATAIATVVMVAWNFVASRWAILPGRPAPAPATWADHTGAPR